MARVFASAEAPDTRRKHRNVRFGIYCAGAAAGLAASAFCGFFFDLSVVGLVSNPGGGLAVSDEDDVGVQ